MGKEGCGGRGEWKRGRERGGAGEERARNSDRGKLTAMALRSSRLSIEPTDFLLSSSSHSFHLLAVVFRLPVSRRLLPVPPAPSWLAILPPIPCRQELAPSLTRQFVSPRFTFQQDVIDQSISQWCSARIPTLPSIVGRCIHTHNTQTAHTHTTSSSLLSFVKRTRKTSSLMCLSTITAHGNTKPALVCTRH